MRASATVCLLALGACKLGGSLDDARFRCSQTSPCPSGRTCLDGYCELEVPADGSPPVPSVLGDALMFTFDDGSLPSFRDRSGHRLDCSGGGATVGEGVYGGAAYLEANNFLGIPDQQELYLGDHLTIEAWLWRDVAGEVDPILGDRTVDLDDVAAEYALEVTAGDRLRFVSNDGCVTGPGVAAESPPDLPVPVGQWVHVAVAWDGVEARFYLDGELAGVVPLEANPCQLTRNPRIGRLQGSPDQVTMIGRIDEVKLSSVAKSAADIRASMEFDSTALISQCGDLIIESEGCDGDSPCCDPDACESLADGDACGDSVSQSCQEGVCQLAGARPSENLVALYDFEEAAGTVITDSSGETPQINLTIGEPGAVSWGDGYLSINADAAIASTSSTGKISDRCTASGELTIDAWVLPAVANQSGQIVAMGNGTDSELALAQTTMAWNGRVRSSGTSGRGTPHVMSALGDVSIELTHLVVRRDQAGVRTLFVNGRERGVNLAGGSLDNWGPHPLALGDESGSNDPWRGRIDRIAIYCRAFSDLEVAASYAAGHAP